MNRFVECLQVKSMKTSKDGVEFYLAQPTFVGVVTMSRFLEMWDQYLSIENKKALASGEIINVFSRDPDNAFYLRCQLVESVTPLPGISPAVYNMN